MPIPQSRVLSIRDQALELAPNKRDAFLDSVCDHPDLRLAVEHALLEHSGAIHPTKLAVSASSDLSSDSLKLPPEPPLTRLAHYAILQTIGKGGFGTVYAAFDEKLHRPVAIKVLAPSIAADNTARTRFIREARYSAAIRNENVVATYAVADDHEPPYIVMELIIGDSLADRFANSPFSIDEIIRVAKEVAAGLAAAHKQGLVHRDIKPGNILIESETQSVKITDFGLARLRDDTSITQSGMIAGTPLYMSPEQAQGQELDGRSDLFSLGSVLYELCVRRSAFHAADSLSVLRRVCRDIPAPIRQINREVPQWLCDIIDKLHAKGREQRFASANELIAALNAGPDWVNPKAEKRPVAAPASQSRLLLFLVSALLACVIASAFLLWRANLSTP
jgi:serine/threonine protein kinase